MSDSTTEALAVRQPDEAVSLGLFGTADPVEVIERAARIATALAKVVNERKLYAIVNGRKFPTVEGWTLLGAMVGVFAHTEWTKAVRDENGATVGYHARVVVKTLHGQELGAAEAMCMRGESKQWGQDAKDFALMSMAQTRATSKAMANPLRWVFKLAGYEGASAEEMSTSTTADGEIIKPSAESQQALRQAQGERPAQSESARAVDSPAAIQAGTEPAMTPASAAAPAKRGPGRPRKDGTPPQPKRQNVVIAQARPVATTKVIEVVPEPTPDEGKEVFLQNLRQDIRYRAAVLARLNALVRNSSEDRVLGREPMETIPPAQPNSTADASLAAMINRTEFYPGQSLQDLGIDEIDKISTIIEQFIEKRQQQLKDLGISNDH